MVAPPRLAAPGGPRRWGVFVPVYAVRDGRTWGVGDLSSFERIGRWAARYGASLLATLPLLPAFLDRPFEPSPYRPVCRRYWNELYLDPRATPEFARSPSARRLVASPAFRRRVAQLERGDRVRFRAVARLKRAVLERMLHDFRDAPRARRTAFRRFVERTEGLREYARFRAELERSGPAGARYHLFAQWLVDEQLARVSERLGRVGVDLLFDLPIGVHPEGFDARADPEFAPAGVSLGSPPDPGVPEGQEWGIRPLHPRRMRERGYAGWAEALAQQFRIARFLRLDHILGLHRLFWVPEGRPPSEGVYVRSPKEELYAVLLAEARRAGGTVVGENLGTVPADRGPDLRRRGILGLYVAQLEWGAPGGGRPVPRDSLATLNTHDHLPFAAYRRARGALPFAGPATRSRRRTPPSRADDLARALGALAASPARLLLVNLEDLWGELRPQNVPGRVRPRPFARRFRVGFRTLRQRHEWSELLCAIDAVRRGEDGQ